MKFTHLAIDFLVAGLLATALGWAADEVPKPVTMDQALKLGSEKLAAATDSSEAGQDIACQLKTHCSESPAPQAEAAIAFVIRHASWVNFPSTGKTRGN